MPDRPLPARQRRAFLKASTGVGRWRPGRRRPRVTTGLLVGVVLFSALGAPATVAQTSLPPTVQEALQAAKLPADALAAAALPLGHDAPAWGWQPEASMQPGSTMKLVTSIVALDRLGPGHRGRTELVSAAPLVHGVLRGDLVLRGGADPELGVPQLWALLRELREQGVREIRGDLVLDRSRFRPARSDLGLPPFDESPEAAYNVIPDALLLAGELLPLVLRSDPQGVHAEASPPLPGLRIRSRMTFNDRACDDWDEDWQPARITRSGGGQGGSPRIEIELQGRFPRGCTVRTGLQLIDRDELAERLFRSLWQGLGGRWTGRLRAAAAPPGARVLAVHEARPWGELLRGMNKESDNALARLLFLEIGAAAQAQADASAVGALAAAAPAALAALTSPASPSPPPSPAWPASAATAGAPGAPASMVPPPTTAALAAVEVRHWLAEHGIADAGLVLDNGSGLSRSERITPSQLVAMLAAAWVGPHASDLMMSLPVAGVDGTMRRRLKDSPAAGWARLKTGSLANAVALAGYLRDAQGRPWAVAAIINHADADRGRPVLDALIDSLARSGAGDTSLAAGPGEGDGAASPLAKRPGGAWQTPPPAPAVQATASPSGAR